MINTVVVKTDLVRTGATMLLVLLVLLASNNNIDVNHHHHHHHHHLARALSSGSASTSTSTTIGSCSAERAACDVDAACQECASIAALAGGADYGPGWVEGFVCHDAYPHAFTFAGSQGFDSIYCVNQGALHCCSFFGDEDSAAECMTNDAATAFWDCLMRVRECSVYDMPCHPESGVVCKADLLVCEEDAECNSCLTSRASSLSAAGEDCETRYPDVFSRTGYEGGFAGGFCGARGAEICCEFEDHQFASDCLANAAMSAYQECVINEMGCLAEDIPCQSSSSSSSSTGSTGSDLVETPSPSSLSSSSSWVTTTVSTSARDTSEEESLAPSSTNTATATSSTSESTTADSLTTSPAPAPAPSVGGGVGLNVTPSPSGDADDATVDQSENSGATTAGGLAAGVAVGSPRGMLLLLSGSFFIAAAAGIVI